MIRKLMMIVITISLLLCACAGDVNQVKRHISPSEIYSEQDIDQAMDVVIRHFSREFRGCTLLELEYSDYRSEAGRAWALQYGADEGIVLISSFSVDGSGGDGSLNPNTTYTNWQWILVRSNGGKWTLKTWGYG